MTLMPKVLILDEYWQQLEPHLPRFSPEEQRVALALYQKSPRVRRLSHSLLKVYLQSEHSPCHASRPSLIRNHRIASEPALSIHQAPRSACAPRLTTATTDNQPHVMDSTASVLSARLPS